MTKNIFKYATLNFQIRLLIDIFESTTIKYVMSIHNVIFKAKFNFRQVNELNHYFNFSNSEIKSLFITKKYHKKLVNIISIVVITL